MNNNFENVLNKIIEPLIEKVVDMQGSQLPLIARRKAIYELFATAVLAGINLSEKTDEKVDEASKRVLEEHFANKPEREETSEEGEVVGTMKKHAKERDYAAKLSTQKGGMMPDGTPRFVTGAEIDPLTGKYKGSGK